MNLVNSVRRVISIAAVLILSGCVSSQMAPQTQDATSKRFIKPAVGLSGIYIYRDGNFFGSRLRKIVSIDSNTIIGATAPKTYFHREIKPGEHILSTETEFGTNELKFVAEEGKIYFFQHYMKMGAFTGGANIEAVSEEEGKKEILRFNEALY